MGMAKNDKKKSVSLGIAADGTVSLIFRTTESFDLGTEDRDCCWCCSRHGMTMVMVLVFLFVFLLLLLDALPHLGLCFEDVDVGGGFLENFGGGGEGDDCSEEDPDPDPDPFCLPAYY